MSTPFHTVVSLTNYEFSDSHLTWNLAAGITAADIGKPMSLDTSAANKAKIAADGKRIIGRLMSVEDRSGALVGTIAHDFACRFAVKAGDVLAIGDTAVGAGNGEIRKWVTGDETDTEIMITEVSGSLATALKV